VFFGVAFGSAASARPCSQACRPHSIAFVYQVCAFLPAIGLLRYSPKMPGGARRGLQQRRQLRSSSSIVAIVAPCLFGLRVGGQDLFADYQPKN